MYEKLFKVLRENPEGTITAGLLSEMGMIALQDRPNSWFGDCFLSGGVDLNVEYDEPIIDIVETIVELDTSSYMEDIAEQAAGEDW